MNTQEVANRLVELCRTGKWNQAQDELYHAEAESIEPAGNPWPSVKGLEGIKKKGEQWQSGIEEIHGFELSDPVFADNYFAIRMVSDATRKGMPRMKFEELCLYQVKDGKITKEQFFYSMPAA